MTGRSARLAGAAIWSTVLAVAGAGLCATVLARATPQQPAFRSAVDLVVVDVQVVDASGTPVDSLGYDAFEVSIGGSRRRVVSAEFIRTAAIDTAPFRPTPVGPTASTTLKPVSDPDTRAGRTYILAFDIGSLTVSDSRALVSSALTFVERLLPSDRVGLYPFPLGPRVAPTTDHALVRSSLVSVVGSRANSSGNESRFNLSPSEVIDVTSESVRVASRGETGRGGMATSPFLDALMVGDEADTIRALQRRHCAVSEMQCGDEILAEANARAASMESRAVQGMNGIRALVSVLGSYSGRKTVVMFSSGMPTSDRPGGRPDLGTLPAVLGRDAAATNTTIYTLHVNSGELHATSAATSRGSGGASTRSRDAAVESRVLEDFSGASGGALLRVPTGSGEYALDRVLRETSAHYLLGVEPAQSDRDGVLRKLQVKVNRRGATVRSRQWVAVPVPTP